MFGLGLPFFPAGAAKKYFGTHPPMYSLGIPDIPSKWDCITRRCDFSSRGCDVTGEARL